MTNDRQVVKWTTTFCLVVLSATLNCYNVVLEFNGFEFQLRYFRSNDIQPFKFEITRFLNNFFLSQVDATLSGCIKYFKV